MHFGTDNVILISQTRDIFSVFRRAYLIAKIGRNGPGGHLFKEIISGTNGLE